MAIESPDAVNEDFNLSTATPTTVLELAGLIWDRFRAEPLRYVSTTPYPHDVQFRVPDVAKARDVLGWEATTSLDSVLDEVIPWIMDEIH
jgi:nucleoside-diphosphate-sugar epimerase